MYPSWSIYSAPDPAHLKFICYYLFSLYLTHVSTVQDQCCRAGPKLTSSGPGHGVGSGFGSGSGSVSQLREKKIIHKYSLTQILLKPVCVNGGTNEIFKQSGVRQHLDHLIDICHEAAYR